LINLEAGMSHYEVPTRITIGLYRMLLCVTFYIEGVSSYQKSINDLNKIKSVLEKNDIGVDDLQFIISKDGSVRINDPLNVVDGTMKGNIKLIAELIKRAKMNEIIE
jgi:hypothetical protein